jgi:ATP-binding cassette subfamily B protein
VDPAIQLWEMSLFDNLAYGDDDHPEELLPRALSRADLLEVLSRLPDGLASNLGEGGALLSGGQGQRVRLGRAILRRQPRLVLLDEPFRGLPRESRRELLARAREHWRATTLLFVSHDVEDTSQLDQVIVIDGGRIVERGDPRALLADASSVYAGLTHSARALRAELWGASLWRKLSVCGGRLGASEALRAPATGDAE